MPKMGLVLQGGGALGAYEYGAVTRLVELGWQPVAVTGVSIGAITAAAVAGARDGDICRSLRQLWDAITLKELPFWPPQNQALFSLFGNPKFWRFRSDYFNVSQWTSVCDVTPMRETLAFLCDFDRLNDAKNMRMAVTATNVVTGNQVIFSNYVGNDDARHYVTPRVSQVRLTPEHILASGSLPPGFPMTVIDGIPYWDGGIFDNTPIEAMLDILNDDEIEDLPLFVVDLFATHSEPPKNLKEVQERMLEISYESRFLIEHSDMQGGLTAFTSMLEEIQRELPHNSPLRKNEAFRRLMRLKALKNIKVIEADHAPMTGGMDFSPFGVRRRYESGYEAVNKIFAKEESVARLAPPTAVGVAWQDRIRAGPEVPA
jgi:NTE family protein